MEVLRGSADDGLGNLLAVQIDRVRPVRGRTHTLTARQRCAIRTAVTGRGRTGTAVGAGAAVQAVTCVAAVGGRGRVGAGLRAGAAAQASAARAVVGRRCGVHRGLEAGAACGRIPLFRTQECVPRKWAARATTNRSLGRAGSCHRHETFFLRGAFARSSSRADLVA